MRKARMARAECPMAGRCKMAECAWETGGSCLVTAIARNLGVEPVPAGAPDEEAT